jgi:hypothetical protein
MLLEKAPVVTVESPASQAEVSGSNDERARAGISKLSARDSPDCKSLVLIKVFNSSTIISFSISRREQGKYNVSGKRIEMIVDQFVNPVEHFIEFNT